MKQKKEDKEKETTAQTEKKDNDEPKKSENEKANDKEKDESEEELDSKSKSNEEKEADNREWYMKFLFNPNNSPKFENWGILALMLFGLIYAFVALLLYLHLLIVGK